MQNYYQPYINYFWIWDDQYEVVEVPMGGTIAYRAYLEQFLDRLKIQGIPPFGAVLLALVATNPHHKDHLALIEDILYQNINVWKNSKRVKQEHFSILYAAIDFLNLLSTIPDQYKSQEGRQILFQVLFQEHQYLHKNLDPKGFQSPSLLEELELPAAIFLKDFKHFAKLKKELPTVESILEKIKGLPKIEEDLEIPEEDHEGTEDSKDLIDELLEYESTFPIAALIRPIWAGLNIPINSAMPSQQRLGGVSDLSNKGDLDQLLLSEFANDDLVFLSRLANMEALFIQREHPPIHNNFQRAVLIDISIFSWGSPKLIHFALALAIVQHPKAKEDVELYLTGATSIPIRLDSVDELIQHLQFVDTSLDASVGIEDFFQVYPNGRAMEVFFISHEESLKSQALQQTLQKHHKQIQYSLVSSDTGTIRFYKHQKSGKRCLQTLNLNLEKHWANPPKKELPKAQLKFDCPLLYPIPTSIKKVLVAPDDAIFLVTGDGKLMKPYYNTVRRKGCIELLDAVKDSYKLAIGCNDKGQYLFLQFNPQNRTLSVRNLSTAREWKADFNDWEACHYEHFYYWDNSFHYYNYGQHYWDIRVVKLGIEIERKTDFPTAWKTKYQEHQQKRQGIRQSLIYKASVLKNIHFVRINENGHLVFNNHELKTNTHGVFKIEYRPPKQSLFTAKKTGEGFEFPDGSLIQINRSGMLLLRSSNINIPTIYIPPVLDGALGVATDECFAGYDYYENPDLKLEKISTTKFEQEYLNAFIEQIIEY